MLLLSVEKNPELVQWPELFFQTSKFGAKCQILIFERTSSIVLKTKPDCNVLVVQLPREADGVHGRDVGEGARAHQWAAAPGQPSAQDCPGRY